VRTVLSPHPDDALLDCWSVLASDGDVQVVNVFAGVPADDARRGWWDWITGVESSAAQMRLRRDEDARALADVGRTAVNLDFLDAQYRRGDPVAVADVLDAALPHLRGEVVYLPAAIGLHVDHLTVRALAPDLRERGYEVRLYADLPYCARYGWPGFVTGGPPGDADAHWAHCLGTAADGLDPAVVRLDDGACERKRRALSAYESQFATLTAGRVSEADMLSFEVTWGPPATEPPSAAASRE
jgi:LmbE family N-acetylglucosaminyl deacetylase